MKLRIQPDLAHEVARYGADKITKCFNCGNCTAVCALSKGETVFPRKQIRYLQVGAREKMLSSVDPWLCYYCGGCSDTCPREAEPGEAMMASRRWLTAMYDWTGLSRRMYEKHAWELGLLAAVALLVLLFFTVPSGFGFRLLAQHPEARETVNLQYFAPKGIVHWGDLVFAVLLGGLLLSNAARMVYFTMRGERISLGAYLLEIKDFVVHVATQKRWMECDNDATKQWLRHLILVSGYGTMFILVVIFLHVFQVEDAGFHWTSLLGYYGTLALLATTIWLFKDRLGKKEQIYKHSQLSDWLFIVLLFLTSVTGILLHLFRLLNLPMPTYVMYTVHLMVAVSMLAVEVPFGKWAHLMYRPLAVYLANVKARTSVKDRETSAALVAGAAR